MGARACTSLTKVAFETMGEMMNHSFVSRAMAGIACAFLFSPQLSGDSRAGEINICDFDPGNCAPKRPATKVSRFFLVNPTALQQNINFSDCHGNFRSIALTPESYQFISTELQADNPGCLASTVMNQVDQVSLDRLGDGWGIIVGESDRLAITNGDPQQALQWARKRITDLRNARDKEAAEAKARSEEMQRAIDQLEQRKLKAKQEAKAENTRRKEEYEEQRVKTINEATNAIESLIDRLFK